MYVVLRAGEQFGRMLGSILRERDKEALTLGEQVALLCSVTLGLLDGDAASGDAADTVALAKALAAGAKLGAPEAWASIEGADGALPAEHCGALHEALRAAAAAHAR